MDNKKNFNWRLYLQASLLGATTKNMILPFEHPFEVFKTKIQSMSNTKLNIKQAVKMFYKQHKLQGFYVGYSTNIVRVTLKEFYRWPLLLFFSDIYAKILPESKSKVRLCSGFSIALAEILFLCPLERIKMTNHSAKSFELKYLFVGMEILAAKQIVSWTSFLYFDNFFKDFMKTYVQQDQTQLEFKYISITSFFVGFMNMICVLPFDFIKTKVQMNHNQKQSITDLYKSQVNKHGLKVMYSGWKFRFIQYYINSMLYGCLLEYNERKQNAL